MSPAWIVASLESYFKALFQDATIQAGDAINELGKAFLFVLFLRRMYVNRFVRGLFRVERFSYGICS